MPLLLHGVTVLTPARTSLRAGLRAHTHAQPGTPASPRAARGGGGDRLARCPVGHAGEHLPGLAPGEGDAALSPPPPPPAPGLCASPERVLQSGSAGRALLCQLGARGRSSAAEGPTAPQEGQMAPGSLLLLGSDHNVALKGSKFIKGFLVLNCCFLTCLQISQEAGKVFW